MNASLTTEQLAAYIAGQLNASFPDVVVEARALRSGVDEALQRLEHCFSRITLKYYRDGKQTLFNHLHSDQYAMFLYYLSNTFYRRESDPSIAVKLYALNKAMHAIDVFYEVQLPEIFAFQHPVGTVLGRAYYSDYYLVYQRCSVGANLDGVYPTLGPGVVMYGGSAVIGDCTIEENCWLSLGTTLLDTSVPSNSVVFGRSPDHVVKPTRRNVIQDIFKAV